MADEQKQEEQKVVEKQQEEKPALTAIEQRAQEQGWVPKDEWDGDPDEWRPAKEFIDRGELFKKIEEQSRTIKEVRRALEDFSKHHQKVKEVEFKRALETLRAQKKEALVEGDADAVVDIDEKIDAVREAQREAAQTPQQTPQADPQNNIVFQGWVAKNGWYNTNQAMRAYADRLGNQLGAEGGMSVTDLLNKVEQEVKREFAHKFNNPNRDKPGAVEGSTNKGSKKNDSFQLTDDERRVMQRFVRTVPGMTEEKYIADLRKIKGE